MNSGDLSTLRSISLTRPIAPPRVVIKSDADVEVWKGTTGYHDYILFITRLNAAVAGKANDSVEVLEKSEVSHSKLIGLHLTSRCT